MSKKFCTGKIEGPFIVIGDVHGHMAPLYSLLENLKKETENFDNRWLVFIGDLIDRGPNPREAVELVINLIKNRGRTTCIMGNHEFVLLSALGLMGEEMKRQYAVPYVEEYSPEPTFISYGVEPDDLSALKKNIPEEHVGFLMSLPWCVEADGHLIVHAGLLPDEPFQCQLEKLKKRDTNPGQPWIHKQSLVNIKLPHDCPVTVISGHVRFPQVVMSKKRILIDTTGGRNGLLSAILLPERAIIRSTIPVS